MSTAKNSMVRQASEVRLKFCILVPIAAWAVFFWIPAAVHAFSTYTESFVMSDLSANPQDFFSWGETLDSDPIQITWNFDDSFTSDERIRRQIRWAFREWDLANVTANGAGNVMLTPIVSAMVGSGS